MKKEFNEWILTPTSSNIIGFKYDDVSSILTIKYKGNAQYNYFDVPVRVFHALEERYAQSGKIGALINDTVKKHYRFAKV